MIEPPPCFSMIGITCFIVEVAALEVHGEHPVPLLLRQLHDAADMGEADVVIEHVDPPINVRARLHHAADVVMAGHVGAD